MESLIPAMREYETELRDAIQNLRTGTYRWILRIEKGQVKNLQVGVDDYPEIEEVPYGNGKTS